MNRQLTASVAVITDPRDAHLPYVQRHLAAPMLVIDPQSLAQGTELSYDFCGGKQIVRYGGAVLDGIRSIWYRKPVDVQANQLPVQGPLADYSLDAIRTHTRQLLTAFSGARWVSDYYALIRASSKTLQLQVALDVGLAVPRTLVTSDPARAEAFIRSVQGDTIAKPYASYMQHSGDLPKAFLATRVNRRRLPELRNLYLAPAIFQQAIDITCDVRVTVVGDRVFAARIHNSGLDEASPVRDWRIGYYQGSIHIEPYTGFPAAVANACVRHAKRLGLAFSAIDLVEDKTGKLWFLENNPNGQWAFVEEEAGLPIGEAVASLLSGGRR